MDMSGFNAIWEEINTESSEAISREDMMCHAVPCCASAINFCSELLHFDFRDQCRKSQRHAFAGAHFAQGILKIRRPVVLVVPVLRGIA